MPGGCAIVQLLIMARRKNRKLSRSAKPGKKARRAAARAPEKAAGATPERVSTILGKLDEAYPAAACELKHENPFQLLISTILSAQCTDERVNQVTKTLFPSTPRQSILHTRPHASFNR